MKWSTYEAERVIAENARRDAQREAIAEAGPCPHCGAPAYVEMIDVTDMTGVPRFIPSSYVTCSGRCYELDPEGYVEAVKRAQ